MDFGEGKSPYHGGFKGGRIKYKWIKYQVGKSEVNVC
jgi:hypothetical protein